MVTGHNELGYHASLCNPEVDNTCSFCNTNDETFFHLATECPALWQTRQDVFLDKPPDSTEWRVKDLMLFANTPALDGMITGFLDNQETE